MNPIIENDAPVVGGLDSLELDSLEYDPLLGKEKIIDPDAP